MGLVAPLADFQQLHAKTLRRFGSWAVDLSYPNPSFKLDDRPYRNLAELAERASLNDMRYSPFGGFSTPRRRVAAVLSEQHAAHYTYRDVILTPGATAALNLALSTLFRPPDRLVVVTPCWMDYPLYLAHLDLGYDPVAADESKHLDLGAIERAWTPHTRGLIISQPASPTGVRYEREEIAELARLLRRLEGTHRQPTLLINDETHRDQIWSGNVLTSPAHLYEHTISVYSHGKAWQMPGQRCGYLAIHPGIADREALQTRLTTAMRVTGYCAPSAINQHLLTALSPFTPDLGPLAEVQRYVRRRLERSGFQVIAAEATYFVYVRAPISNDTEYVRLAAEKGVLVMPSQLFHERGYFRIALNLSGPSLDRALDILATLKAALVDDHA